MRLMNSRKMIFITGTDTGVGKTLLTCLLLYHLRRTGVNCLALKPFCSGMRNDVRLLQKFQENVLKEDEINPFFFLKPTAPVVASKKCLPSISRVIDIIQSTAAMTDLLLIEGIGGVMVPLGKDYAVIDLIRRLQCPVIVVGKNKIGTVNHTLLTVEALQKNGIDEIKILLMREAVPDPSWKTNPRVLRKWKTMPFAEINQLPFLGCNPLYYKNLENNYKKIKKTLARLVGDH